MTREEITREEAVERLEEATPYVADDIREALYMAIEALQAEPVKRGEWRRMKRTNMWYKCSLCEWESAFAYHFCPNCGAKMDG